MTHYNEELQLLQQKLARKRRLEKMLKDLHSQRTELQSKVRELDSSRQKEQTDVDRLEGRSLSALFYRIVGKKEEKLDEQRREAYAAAMKHDVAVRELAAVEENILQYESELAELRGCEMEYARVLKEKVKAIKATANPVAEKILQYEEHIAYLENQKTETNEAIHAGNKAKSIADAVLSELNDAEGWGTWDLLGGGLISDLAKHSSLDDAQEKIEQLQLQLRRFKTELADVTIQADMQVSIDGFLRFADYFFDGLFADWAVLDKIEESQGQVKQTKQQIESVLQKLAGMLDTAEKDLSDTKAKLDELVVNATLQHSIGGQIQ